jgi:two-component system chemotaxis response regulator CheY
VKVLIVDDSRVMRQIVVRTLRQAGYGHLQVVEAENGAEALTKVSTEEPELILCDWNMPQMTGIDFLRALRGGGDSRPFGFVTSEATTDLRESAARAGANFFITKPFTPDVFGETLAAVLS